MNDSISDINPNMDDLENGEIPKKNKKSFANPSVFPESDSIKETDIFG